MRLLWDPAKEYPATAYGISSPDWESLVDRQGTAPGLSLHEVGDRLAVQAGELTKFHDIYPAFSRLTLRNERLRTGELSGHLNLSKTRLTTGFL